MSVLLRIFFGKEREFTNKEKKQGQTVQLVLFLAAEFPVQLLIKRFGFRRVLPLMMVAWSLVSWTQAWMSGRASFYVTRALIGALEGGFIPGTILFATYFYKTRELATRLAFFWSSLNVCAASFPGCVTLTHSCRLPGSYHRCLQLVSCKCAVSEESQAGSGYS